jgi:tRNA threonylcarbamoyladenosine biosynthesis protein TsaB
MLDIMPHASQVAQLAQLALARGHTVGAADAQPLYLRNKIAYTSAERQVINAAKAAA